jgi:hypothetical protein
MHPAVGSPVALRRSPTHGERWTGRYGDTAAGPSRHVTSLRSDVDDGAVRHGDAPAGRWMVARWSRRGVTARLGLIGHSPLPSVVPVAP